METKTIVLKMGKETCSFAPGQFCQMLFVTRMGTTPVCNLFNVNLPIDESKGVLRCKQCLSK